MRLERGEIPSTGMLALLICFVLGSSLLLTPGGSAGHDAWVAVLLGLAEGLLIAQVYAALTTRFPGKTLVEISDLVYGRCIGKIVAALFLWYLFHLGSLVLSNFEEMLSALILQNTPSLVISLGLILVCAYAVNEGIEVLVRCSYLLGVIIFATLIFDILAILPLFEVNRLLPVLDLPVPRLLLTAHGAASFPFLESVSFLMVMPFLNKSSEAGPSLMKGLLLSGVILAVIVARNSGVLGETTKILIYPSYQTVEMINILDIGARLEVLVFINVLTMGFIKVATLYYGTVLGVAQLFRLRTYKPLVLPIGILMLILSLQDAPNTPVMVDFAMRFYPFYSLPFQIVIPALTLILAHLRRPRREAAGP